MLGIIPSADNLEIITVSVCYGPSKVLISLFYGTPNSSSQAFEDLFLFLHLQSLIVGSLCNYNFVINHTLFIPSFTVILNHLFLFVTDCC